MRSVYAPVPGIVSPAENNEEAKREIRKLNVALQDAERAHDNASQLRLKSLLAFGQRLRQEREKDPSKKSKSFAGLLRDCGIDKSRASEAMKYAGYVEEKSSESELSDLPSLREAGIDTKPRKSEDESASESGAKGDPDWDIAQIKVCDRIKTFAEKMPLNKRGELAFSLRQLADAIEEMNQ